MSTRAANARVGRGRGVIGSTISDGGNWAPSNVATVEKSRVDIIEEVVQVRP